MKEKTWKDLRGFDAILKPHRLYGVSTKTVDKLKRGTDSSKLKSRFVRAIKEGIEKDWDSKRVIRENKFTGQYFDDQMTKLLTYLWKEYTRRKYAKIVYRHYYIRYRTNISFGGKLAQSTQVIKNELERMKTEPLHPEGFLKIQEIENRAENANDNTTTKRRLLPERTPQKEGKKEEIEKFDFDQAYKELFG